MVNFTEFVWLTWPFWLAVASLIFYFISYFKLHFYLENNESKKLKSLLRSGKLASPLPGFMKYKSWRLIPFAFTFNEGEKKLNKYKLRFVISLILMICFLLFAFYWFKNVVF